MMEAIPPSNLDILATANRLGRPTPGPPQRLLVVMPTWVGDCVMATPTLRVIRSLIPAAKISVLVKQSVRPMIDGVPWVDHIITTGSKYSGKSDARRKGSFRLVRRLAAGQFDTAVILPNSFRSALIVAMAGVPRRIGYDRDGRGFLLTDRLLPRRNASGYVPVPTRDYYLGMARFLGATDPDPTMQLFERPKDKQEATQLLARGGFAVKANRPLVLLSPGARFGDAKMWAPKRFAVVADQCSTKLGAVVGLIGSPSERSILDQVLKHGRHPMIDLPRLGLTLPLLKSIVRESDILVTNDTGPRHIAVAMGTPVVTIFGPTDPRWTEIGCSFERQVRVKVYCGPCQQKVCPLKGTNEFHQCMTRIDPSTVYEQVVQLLGCVGVSA